jgi:mannose-6-phosphate isomerase-like protein (cupin superfamily)
MSGEKGYVFIPVELIEATLMTPHTPGKKELEPLKSFAIEHNLPFKIHEHPGEFGMAEVHMAEDDVWVCIRGAVEFIVGGTLKGDTWFLEKDNIPNPNEIRAAGIENGNTVMLKNGDYLVIPVGIPHMHRGTGQARSLIWKIPVKK